MSKGMCLGKCTSLKKFVLVAPVERLLFRLLENGKSFSKNLQ
ncbi:hypothetical protein T11_18258 [Trichinella zimbabwensis]|uniref:Uncharacterized protein n=1 Tax=Trichinella zimbabwensis TaxID=268475 RepID=A0A0V1GEB4_9BILA|nr:hypothetical protein T11_18258 [Trichinella zimbabwensis]